MRGGPSTGIPTKAEQSDLFQAAFSAHGDVIRPVLAPVSAEGWNSYHAPHCSGRFRRLGQTGIAGSLVIISADD